jgi:hypothetical protein
MNGSLHLDVGIVMSGFCDVARYLVWLVVCRSILLLVILMGNDFMDCLHCEIMCFRHWNIVRLMAIASRGVYK